MILQPVTFLLCLGVCMLVLLLSGRLIASCLNFC